MVSNTFWHRGAYIGVIRLNNMYPNGSPFLLPYLGYNMTYEPTSGICDNLFTKHLTHMAYISKPLVRKFRILKTRRLNLFQFEIFKTTLRNRSTLTFREQYTSTYFEW